MKADLIGQLEALLQTEDITTIKQGVRELRDAYNALTDAERKAQQAAWDEAEHEEGEDFNFVPAAEDERFEALLNDYRGRVKAHKEKIAEAQRENLKAKTALLDQLEQLIKEEENVAKAFETFHSIEDAWKAIGDIPSEQVKDVQDRHLRLRDEFYYNVKIYKELRDLDLKINLKKKEELIERAKGLAELDDIKEIEMLARSYQKEWSEIGPSPRETWKEVGDTFFGFIRTGYDKVQAHYDALRAEQEVNLEKKRALIDQMRELITLEINNHSVWTKNTEKVLGLQKAWKESGYVGKPAGDEMWKEFRAVCDLFFEKKNLFYAERKQEQQKSKAVKEEIVAKALALKEATDWKKTTDAIIQLQNDWKKAGPAPQSDERRLWTQFRSACDHFFAAKKAHFAGMGERHEANQQEKEALIKELESFELTGQRSTDMETLKGFQTKWNSIGHVPKASMKPLNEAFFGLLDAHWDTLKANKVERSVNQYKNRIENLKAEGEGEVKRERRLLREKIDRLKQRVLQYENNLNFLTGPGAEDFKKDIDKKIRVANEEIEEIKRKLKLFNEA